MNGIIVGLDESAPAADALRWAVREGALHDAPVTAVMAWAYLGQHHATPDHPFDPGYGESNAAAVLDELIARTVGPAAVDVGRAVVCDLPGPGLVEASTGADLLVVGARGLGGFRGLLLGSASRHCLHHAVCPVAVVRDEEDRSAHPPGGVVVGIDGSDTSVRALAWAVREARARQSSLTVVHAYRTSLLDAVDYAAPALRPDMLEQAARDTLARTLAQVDMTGLATPQHVVVDAGASAAILDAARSAGVVVVGSRGVGGVRGFVLGSVSDQVSQHAPCPVVVIPPPDREEPEAPST